MQIARAVQILERLRDGEDPRTGRPLPSGPAQERGPIQDPETVRALYTVLAALPEQTEALPARVAQTGKPPRAGVTRPHATRAGQPWTDSEDERLAAGFDAGDSV